MKIKMKAAERVTIQVKATEQYFMVVLFIVQYKVVLKPGQQYFTRWFSFSSVFEFVWSSWYCIRKAKRMEDISMAQQQPNP